MFVKIHKSYRIVVAICDAELIGKRFEENFENGVKQLDITESFFKGEQVNHEKIMHIIKTQSKEDATFNIVGEKAIKAALESGLIKEEGVLKIAKIPYALVLL